MMLIRAFRVHHWTEAKVHTGSEILGRVDRESEKSNGSDQKEVSGVVEFSILPGDHPPSRRKNVEKGLSPGNSSCCARSLLQLPQRGS